MLGPAKINIELSSVCTKNCWMCGRRKRDREMGDQEYGYMDLHMVQKIADQLSSGTLVAFHWNGDPLHYPYLGDALRMFDHCVTYMVTNGMLLVEKAGQLIGNTDVISVSIIEGEVPSVRVEQLSVLKKFLAIKGDSRPNVVLRFVGNVSDVQDYHELGCLVAKRALHAPDGSYDYRKNVVIPEHGICLDLLHGLAIDRYGNISVCVRYDPNGELRLGNVSEMSVMDAWSCDKRKELLGLHVSGNRKLSGFCWENCHYFGCPTM